MNRLTPAQRAKAKATAKRPGTAGAPSALTAWARKILARTRASRLEMDSRGEGAEE